jgi:hypothetical protein
LLTFNRQAKAFSTEVNTAVARVDPPVALGAEAEGAAALVAEADVEEASSAARLLRAPCRYAWAWGLERQRRRMGGRGGGGV